MAMLTQAFRFAYEPFVFSKSKEKDSREMYAKAMKFFIIFPQILILCNPRRCARLANQGYSPLAPCDEYGKHRDQII